MSKKKDFAYLPVLILNSDGNPLSRFPLSLNIMKKVLKSLFKGHINVIKEYDKTIHISNKEIRLPKIVMLNRYIKVDHKPKFSRKNIYLRDNYTCQYCGQKFSAEDLTFDHLIPRKNGGQTTWDNIVTCCKACNCKKGCKSAEEVGMHLLSQPHIPTIKELERNQPIKNDLYNDWLSEAYWESELEN
jgi:5-methylcytosine-specific restriction endonuclease McrA